MLPPIIELERTLARLPGLGRRSAGRAALALVREQARLLDPLITALRAARDQVVCCPLCGGFTTRDKQPCALCTDPTRASNLICVVEEAADVVTIESSGAYKGRYHVLGGKLSPVHHTGPEKLRIPGLVKRITTEGISEVLLALSTDMEGDATAGFLVERLHQLVPSATPLRITRLAFGLPADSGVAYSDPLTLRRAILHRCEA